MRFGNSGPNNAGIVPGNTPVMQVNTLPLLVPIVTGSTAPSASTNQQTGLPTPTNVQTSPAASTVITAGGLASRTISEIEAIITHPSQHIIRVIVLLAIGWFVWKHR